ncbi:Lin1244/Lin1753 domain-containing protein [Clostridium beijerinckii]|uniref:DnaD/phage-associated family protein n=1 Tax=Clostridium beijerinckii TaxID=1520 RepID=A0AAE5LRF9_CLOBE|nr:Lin1244/Lin1753 domain-containing protein [Clostridium beijerinckii]NSB15941.1 DnaD/phage-associated family protein [Clostridium beijerinckii]OOM33270.1 replication initiation and membrane attachment [Clostridium beijerinckii]
MARPVKEGLSYFPFDVDFFSDRKIKILKSRYGADGITLYMYLLCEVYKSNGYYLETDDDFLYIISDDLNMSYEKIRQIMNFLLERSLFDDTLFKSDKVLTSIGIQRRFQEAIKSRASKRTVEITKFWLLEKNETQSFIKVNLNPNKSENNSNKSENNSSKSEINDTKKSKVNKNKVKESKVDNNIFFVYENCGFGTINNFTKEQLEALVNDFSFEWTKEAIEIAATNKARDLRYVQRVLENWRDRGKNYVPTYSKNNVKVLKFNNFEPREYDYDKLEKRLLGWDDD